MPHHSRRPSVGLLLAALAAGCLSARAETPKKDIFARDNLIAWCIVPFDSKNRDPETRAAMLEKLGFKHFAYDWRGEHVPTFDAEVDALKKHGVALDAWWCPGELNDDSKRILDVLKRHDVKAQLWVLVGVHEGPADEDERKRRVEDVARRMKPLAEAAAKQGCVLGLYNHGGWFGEPENQIAIIERLKRDGATNLGIVYNQHHGHDHLDRFPALLRKMMPYLLALNINGMDPQGDRVGRKILPLGQGSEDLKLLKIIRESGYGGPIGILGHTSDDAEERLKDNLDGLEWLRPQLDGKPAGPRPKPRTPVPPPPAKPAAAAALDASPGAPAPAEASAFSPERIAALLADARTNGDPKAGAMVFSAPGSACLTCHRVGDQGANVGPDLSAAGACLKPEEIVEAIHWPRRTVKEGFVAVSVAKTDGTVRQGFKVTETDREIVLRDPPTGEPIHIPRSEVEAVREDGTLMPVNLLGTLSPEQRRDLLRFVLDLGKPGAPRLSLAPHAVAEFPYTKDPLKLALWPNRNHRVNRDRIYEFYSKEADYFSKRPEAPMLLPPFPGVDGGKDGHWGNQNEEVWADDRWNLADLGTLQAGIFRGAGVSVAKGVCVRLGERGELAACFNPETLRFEAVWSGGFLKFSRFRHGLLDGVLMDGTPRTAPTDKPASGDFLYRGFFRHGKRTVFAYRRDGVEWLDAPWIDEKGEFAHLAAPIDEHPLRHLAAAGEAQWPQTLHTKGKLGPNRPYAVDTITPPFENPWRSLLFFAGHDFRADGSAFVCTMTGDVWKVDGLDATLADVRWKRFAAGLSHPLGLVVVDGEPYVLGRDQITKLRDLNGDGEADFYECFSNRYATSVAGHDFICGLQRDVQGRFYTASGNQGILRIAADGKSVETIATGFRNPDGLGLAPDGTLTVPSSEGEWTPSSMISEIRLGGHYGYPGPKGNAAPDLPLVYVPRGLDNSSGEQAWIPDGRMGPLGGHFVHLSFGTGTTFLLLRDKVGERAQGALVPLPGDFDSGIHRGRFNPNDGALYLSGMTGWGTYTPSDGCFQRLRYTGDRAQLPVSWRAHRNGVVLGFSQPLDGAVAGQAKRHFAQAWNYRYSSGYGSPELSTRHPAVAGHDPVAVRSAHVLSDGRSLFLEMPDIQPVNVLHLHVRPDSGGPVDLFATVHELAPDFRDFPGYTPEPKTVAAHPILADMRALAMPPIPNPFRTPLPDARVVTIEAGKNLSYSVRSFRVRAGEAVHLTFLNPDVVPHNWALCRPGTLAKVGDLVNKIIADPDAARRQYVPKSDDVLVYTDITTPQEKSDIFFRAPTQPGRYPYLCTFPGHWMVMNGEMIVE